MVDDDDDDDVSGGDFYFYFYTVHHDDNGMVLALKSHFIAFSMQFEYIVLIAWQRVTSSLHVRKQFISASSCPEQFVRLDVTSEIE